MRSCAREVAAVPSDVRFADLRQKLESHGWVFDRSRGSHFYFTHADGPPMSIPVHGGKVSFVYARKVDKAIEAQRKKGAAGDQA